MCGKSPTIVEIKKYRQILLLAPSYSIEGTFRTTAETKLTTKVGNEWKSCETQKSLSPPPFTTRLRRGGDALHHHSRLSGTPVTYFRSLDRSSQSRQFHLDSSSNNLLDLD